MLRTTAIWMTLIAAIALSGCSSRRGDRLSESDYPYAGPPSENSADANHRHGSDGRVAASRDASRGHYVSSGRYASSPGGTGYYGNWAYAYGRDPSYDYYLASDDYDGEDEYGYPEDVSYFYDELDPYGDWYQDNRYGWVWSPGYVSAGWRPYLYGHWVYTDWGWAWVSDDAWSADTYHYGRWNCDASNRWFWVPDDVWAPAWVSWRYGDGWAGWAPLPSEASWDVSFGLRYADDLVYPSRWCFVPESRLTSTRLRTYVAPLRETRRIYSETRDLTRYAAVDGRVAERGLRPALIERRTGTDIPEYRLQTRESGLRRDVVRGRTLVSPMPVLARGGGRGRMDRVTGEMRSRQARFDREMRTRQGGLGRERIRQDRFGQEQARGRGEATRMERNRAMRGEAMRMERDRAMRDEARGRAAREDRVRQDRAVQQQRFEQQRQERFDRRQQRFDRQPQQRFDRQPQQRFERQPQQRFERQQQRFERQPQQDQPDRGPQGRMQRDRAEYQNRGRAEQQARREEARQQADQGRYQREQARQQADQEQFQRREQARQQADQAQYQRQQRQQQQEQPRQPQARGRQERQQPQPSDQPDQGNGGSQQQGSDQRGHGRGRGHNR